MQGFINGIQGKIGSAIAKARDLASQVASAAKGALGINSPSRVFMEIGKFTGEGFVKGLTGTESDIKQAAESVIGKIREAFKGKNSKLDDQLIASVRSAQKKLTKLAADRAKVAEQIKKANDLATSVTNQAVALGGLSNLGRNGGGVRGVIDGIDAAITKIRQFNVQVNGLAEKGLRKDLLSQLIGLGPDQGAGLAKTLSSATDQQIAELNEAQKQLTAASKKLGQDSADKLFDAGEQASKGFLAGLKAQQKDVEDLMLTLARSMAKAIRTALGIKSPSKVFRSIGRYTMDGLGLGIEDRVSGVRRSVLGAANAITQPFGVSGSLGTVDVNSGRQGAAQRVGGSVTNNRTVAPVFHITEVGSAEATAERVMQRLAMAGGL